MSERLKKIKQYYSAIDSLEPDLQEDIPWLIEQAERAQELEKQVKRHKKEKYKCLKKKQRCEQALESIKENSEDKVAVFIAKKALEADTHV